MSSVTDPCQARTNRKTYKSDGCEASNRFKAKDSLEARDSFEANVR